METFMLQTLLKKISSPGTVTLTANSRLTRYLQNALNEHQKQTHLTWETPQIMPLQAWLINLFYQTNHDGLWLLSDFQEQCVWESIIEQFPLASELLHPVPLAKRVKEAWEILSQWRLSTDILKPFDAQLETACLIEWLTIFQKKCREKNWITLAELPQQFLQQHFIIPLPKKIILMGFDNLNPIIKTLLCEFEKKCLVEIASIETNSQACKIILEDTETEIMTMAKWVKNHYEKNPNATVGCIVPELGNNRAMIKRIFTEVFGSETLFNISAGTPLTENTMIHSAFTLLQWCHHTLPIEQVAAILQSPQLCENETDACIGAQLDAILRDKNQLTITLSDIISAIAKLQTHYPNHAYLTRWRILFSAAREKIKLTMKPSEWASHFIALLKIMHWPGVRTQTSNEFQALERFKKILHEFSQLDWFYAEIVFSRALQLLQSLAQQTIFQPKSHHEPIQIMGALEASGIIVDALWVMGLHDGIWPPATKPHPLIPYSIQQHYHMPHATAERELQFCEHVTNRLKNAAKHVIFSSPSKEGDQHLFPSRLIQDIALITVDQLKLSLTEKIVEKLFRERKVETFTDDRAPEIQDTSRIQGGSTILKLQTQCPFRAFATIRLKTKALNKPTIGISAVTKGIIIHHILFEIWDYLKDQHTLQMLSDDILNQFIQDKIDSTLVKYLSASSNHHHFIQIEKKRLHVLIKNWLTLEKSRPAFRIKALEESGQISIDQLPMTIRLDRIDELSDGSLMLIDYKTGKNEINTLLQERLTHPQLPIYAVFHTHAEQTCESVAFAEVRNAKMNFTGLMHERMSETKNNAYHFTAIHKTKNKLLINNWDALLSHWKSTLVNVANDFCKGNAIVNPIDSSVCETCDLKSVCRVGVGVDA
ncbi:MAG: hypothetical protein A3C44_01710 [Gammaproteobacteria bacterium RIFCSPHIGHO2_02_FULL_39_13]|nr:MAG: hypothetical protein A3C44_01710 [Gammaproteobacteria bacterium RIFCSPHIGHO2_02_FULL_39_13]